MQTTANMSVCLFIMMAWMVAFMPLHAEDEMRESQEQTISRCIRDLKSQDVAVRRRAALLLGKYSTPEAEVALLECLHDDDAQIRLGALVSLTEDHHALPMESNGEVLRLLADTDVHVRRLASSLLPMALSGISAQRIVIRGNVRFNRGGLVTDEQRSALMRSLEDEDASVRKNVLTACRMCGVEVPHEKLRVFLRDESVEIRLLALQLYTRLSVKDSEALEEVAILADDSSVQVRLELCRCISQFGGNFEPILRKFLNDEASEIRVAAIGQLVRLHVPDGFELLTNALWNKELSIEMRKSLVDLLRLFPVMEAMDVYRRLLEDDSITLAGAAMLGLSRYGNGIEDISIFIPYLEHPNQTVAERALQGIRIRMAKITAKDVSSLVTSKNKAARDLAVRQGLVKLKKEDAEPILLEACMDDDQRIRLAALQQLARLRPDGWKDILIASLEDDDAQIQEAAATELCRIPLPDIKKALKDYLPKCRNAMLAARIRRLVR